MDADKDLTRLDEQSEIEISMGIPFHRFAIGGSHPALHWPNAFSSGGDRVSILTDSDLLVGLQSVCLFCCRLFATREQAIRYMGIVLRRLSRSSRIRREMSYGAAVIDRSSSERSAEI